MSTPSEMEGFIYFYYLCVNFPDMINSVRNTVLAIANKQNFGYITPADFNLYAKQAQLDIFEDYFYRYNQWVLKQNSRVSGSEYADIVRNLEEVIDSFSTSSTLTLDSDSTFDLPSDFYFLTEIRSGNNTADRVSNANILKLTLSHLTAPTTTFPAYVMNGSQITLYPTTIDTGVTALYIRRPLDPRWTYASFSGGEPVFNESAADYQNFELPETDEPLLVSKILQYAGISIREADIYQAGVAEETTTTQKQG